MTGALDSLNQILQTLFLGPHNWIFFSVVGLVAIAGMFLKRGFKKEVKVEEAAPDTPTAEEYLKKDEAEHQPGESKEPQVDSPTPQLQSLDKTEIEDIKWRLDHDQRLTRQELDDISLRLDRLDLQRRASAYSLPDDKTVHALLQVEVEGDLPLSALKNASMKTLQVTVQKDSERSSQSSETSPTEGG